MRGITVLRTDPDDPLRKISLGKMDIGDRRHRENSVESLRRHDSPECPDVLPIIPETEQAATLVSGGEYVLLHFRWDREGRHIAANDEEVDLPTAADPAMTQIRDHALRAAPEVHAVDVDADFHLLERHFTMSRCKEKGMNILKAGRHVSFMNS
jgi:hypothetical protein